MRSTSKARNSASLCERPSDMGLGLLSILGAFLLGSLPHGLWVGQLARGIDVREHGSGNLGATNVYRTLGPRLGLIVLFLDMAKGALSVLLVQSVLPEASSVAWLTAWSGVIGMFAALLGHMFSPFAQFRGGKGVATAAGAWAVLTPAALGLAFLAWVVVFLLSRIVSAASIAAAIVLPIGVLLFDPSRPEVILSIITGALVLLRHRGNLQRLFRGDESRFDVQGRRS